MRLLPALLLAAAAPVAPSDTVVGRWKTETHNGIVDIQRCGASICGRIVTSDNMRAQPDMKDANNKDAASRGRSLHNLEILKGFTWSDGVWSGGTIYNAEDGRTYSAKITPIDANQLKLRGCVFVPVCKTQVWTRVH
ncbi:DUF2147 domain-containing protein [uncultured Sphingomonas sp.]|uniref:DUF2147 domain-containing protein n=1 Tax=uncultured Sphingomonas sp. TaxID=158754 RepID=UPI0035CC9855